MASPIDGALAPQELLSRLTEGAMALATGALAAESFDEYRAAAYARGTALAETALQVAAGRQEQQLGDLLAELAEITDTLSQRMARLEEQQDQQEVAHGGS